MPQQSLGLGSPSIAQARPETQSEIVERSPVCDTTMAYLGSITHGIFWGQQLSQH
jgi:hypothetical protein